MNTSCRDVTVLEMRSIGQSEKPGLFFELCLDLPDWKGWNPGQFIMLRPVNWGLELTWGRPFSISGSGQGWFSIFFQVLGRGTSRLAELATGDKVTVWGPLGNEFAMEQDTPTLLMAGGVGLAPFMAYSQVHPKPESLELFFAHRVSLECYPMQHIHEQTKVTTMREKTTSDLPMIIEAIENKVEEYKDGLILCCGPTPFMRTVQKAALKIGARAQVSLENRMACGVGACLGCVCSDGKGNNVRTCTRGPVFWATDVEL